MEFYSSRFFAEAFGVARFSLPKFQNLSVMKSRYKLVSNDQEMEERAVEGAGGLSLLGSG